MQYSEKLAKYVKKRREELGVSISAFAIENELENPTLSRYENFRNRILSDNFIKIAKGFGRTPAEFLADFEKDCL